MAGMDGAATLEGIDEQIEDGIAWLGLSGRDGNRLTASLCAALDAALERAEADAAVACIVLHGADGCFSKGELPSELESRAPQTRAMPGAAELCLRIERCGKPVIAALQGAALGTGAELALAAHYRVASPGTRFGLTNHLLGLPPVAGATQRLPRLLGAGPALDLLLSGKAVLLDAAPQAALLDRLAQGPLDEEVRAFCAELRAEGLGPRPSAARREGFADPAEYQRAVAARRAETAKEPNPARREIVAAVEAAQLLPFASGLAFEADAYEDCRASDAGRALRACAAAERSAFEAVPRGLARRGHVAVLGDGPLAVPMVQGLLAAGEEVDWGCDTPEALHAGVIALRDRLGPQSDGDDETSPLERLRVGAAAEMAAAARIVLLAGPGQRAVPIPEDAIRVIAYPARVDGIGLRFAPTPVAPRLVEVIAGPGARADRLAEVEALALRLGKLALRVQSGGESLGGRLFDVLCRAADALVDLGQSPDAIDAACRVWGWRRGPFVRRDQMGLDRLGAQQRGPGAANWASVLAGAGRPGRSGDAGFYDWDAAGKPHASAEVEALLNETRPAADPMPAARLRALLLAALANEGARMLETGMARCASDIDLVALQVLDLPRWRGGPMHAASELGAAALRKALAEVTHPDREIWAPHPAWQALAAAGGDWDVAAGAGAPAAGRWLSRA
ncbi:enoyl-CoA hydratase/isomerase family protein [Salipiger sp. CCB-MM3]|uniref:enoyl-CoA hydratase/isomerase family protein n=1 Tax=Salipiger sp. CCB-MM3 TaxID=1792508 RepID=UPI0009F2C7E4|nr:enoyl-CoA hydratase/isomerase family protein [Salipiger sp. CCB-MM3]